MRYPIKLQAAAADREEDPKGGMREAEPVMVESIRDILSDKTGQTRDEWVCGGIIFLFSDNITPDRITEY